jgi:hypothetical protein
MKKYLKTILPVISLAALILSACNAPSTTATPTDGVSAIYTAAAQTIVAQVALATATPRPTGTVTPTQTVTAAITATQSGSTIPTLPVSQPACDKSVYISDVTIPDNTVVLPGQVFDKTWALMNTGTCAWTTAYSMTFVSGEKMGGSSTLLTQAVPSQQQANVTVKLTAPTTAGTYTGYWRLANSQGSAFGQQVSVVIIVSGSGTATTTATPRTTTATPGTATATNPPASTSTPTATTAVVPTNTETPTATATPH